MCVFELWVEQCLCNDRKCKLKVTALGENEETYQGHIVQVITCFRRGRTCMGMFTNTSPDRPLVKLGKMREENGNSKQDCKDAVYVYPDEKEPRISAEVCVACLLVCDWKGNHSSKASSSNGAEEPKSCN